MLAGRPLQNRVPPTGDIVAVPSRGMFMGNRGVLHDETQHLGKRRWVLKAWIICQLEFRGRQRTIMAPRRYTELFFFDEAAAIAAGHRPCYECRRQAAMAWRDAWRRAKALPEAPRASDMDAVLHRERVDANSRLQRRWPGAFDDLPDGAFVLIDDRPHLILGDSIRPWSWSGYGAPKPRPQGSGAIILTPPSAVAVLREGYQPELHSSAHRRNAIMGN
jgi:hypothetical protein